jgi:hypothetical protein
MRLQIRPFCVVIGIGSSAGMHKRVLVFRERNSQVWTGVIRGHEARAGEGVNRLVKVDWLGAGVRSWHRTGASLDSEAPDSSCRKGRVWPRINGLRPAVRHGGRRHRCPAW